MQKAKRPRKKANKNADAQEPGQPEEEVGGVADAEVNALSEAELCDIPPEVETLEDGRLKIGSIEVSPPPMPSLTFDNTKPRLCMTNIEIDQFKSFGEKVQLGPFHKRFTSIIGPNGSGKSNVIDSMLFVFGYRAQKIRSKSLAVLIHSSENHPNLQNCTVTVTFHLVLDQPGEDFIVIPDSKLEISRTVHRDNTSYYQLDGRRSTFREVTTVLRKFGVDLDHNRFLILQGEVEQIALMKPKAVNDHDTGMLEFLEDIIGSVRLKEPIDKLYNRAEKLNELRTEKLNRVRLVEQEKEALEEGKEGALQYLRLENKLIHLQNKVNQIYMYNMEADMAENEEKVKKIQEKVDAAAEELSGAKEESGKATSLLNEINQKHDQLTQKRDANTARFDEMNRRDAELKEDSNRLVSQTKKNRQQIETEKTKLKKCLDVPEKNKKEIEEMEQHSERLQAERTQEEQKLQAETASVGEATREMQDNKAALENQLVELKKNCDDAKKQHDLAKAECDLYLSTEKNEKAKLEGLQKSLEDKKEAYTECKKKYTHTENHLPEMEKRLREAKKELDVVTAEMNTVSAELQQKRITLETNRSSMQASRSRGRLLDALMREKQNGNMPGVFGRLGDLGGIDGKYDVAISSACGPLDNVVVDTVETAKQCIEFLKRNDLGRETFIALEKQEHLRQYCNNKQQWPENVPRLFDLIQIKDKRVETAFYYALHDTLVATDLNQASRIAYGAKRHRVVTLKGEVFELAGTLSGGGRPSKGRMGRAASVCDISAKDIQVLERDTENLAGRLRELGEQQHNLEAEIDSLQRQIPTARTDLKKIDMDINALKEQQQLLQKQCVQQEKRVKEVVSDPKKVKQMQGKVNDTQEALDEATKAAGKIEKEVQKIHNKIISVSEAKLHPIQKKLDDCVTKLEKTSASIRSLTAAISTAERNTRKGQEKIAQLEQDIQDAQTDLAAKKEERDRIEAEGTKIFNETREIAKEMVELEEQLKEIGKEQKARLAKETKLKSMQLDLAAELNKCKNKTKEIAAKISAIKYKLDSFQLQKIPVFGRPLETRQEEDKEANPDHEDLDPEDSLPKYEEAELKKMDLNALTTKSTDIAAHLKNMEPNLAVLQEYRKKEELYMKRVEELDYITERRDLQRKHVDTLKKMRLSEFMTGFGTITSKVKEVYQMLTLGGDAELEVVDSLDPFSEGIVFSVRPPKKSWKQISHLSGGEKTLSSLALIFALHYYKPTPLYVMDEIDAALDFRNVCIVGNYIKECTKNAQFIVISLRSNMFELANRLVGIYKTYDCTKSVTVNPHILAAQVAQPILSIPPQPVLDATGTEEQNQQDDANGQ